MTLNGIQEIHVPNIEPILKTGFPNNLLKNKNRLSISFSSRYLANLKGSVGLILDLFPQRPA